MFAHIIIQICTIMMYDFIIPVDYRLLPAEPEPVEAAALYLDPWKICVVFPAFSSDVSAAAGLCAVPGSPHANCYLHHL